jgi:hypothetical protein
MKTYKTHLVFSAIVLATLACTLPFPIPVPVTEVPTGEPTPEVEEGETPVELTEEAEASATPEPGLALYYIANPEGSYQVYRYAPDGSTSRMTNAPGDLSNYAVNPVDGSIAYVLNNILYIKPTAGDAYELLAGGVVDEADTESLYRNQLGSLAWSPDGNTLAYGLNGIHLYTMPSGVDQHLLTNVLQDFGEGNVFPGELYFPEAWSPDGSVLLIQIAYLEAGNPAVMDPATGGFTQLTGGGIVCCHIQWSPDSDEIFVASPIMGMIEPGLWRYPRPGVSEVILLPGDNGDGTFNFAGWPIQLGDGSLNFFYANVAGFPEFEDIPLTMVNAHPDTMGTITSLRPESWNLYEALWLPSGSAAYVVQVPPAAGFSTPRVGPILLIDTAGAAPSPVAPSGYALQWGP